MQASSLPCLDSVQGALAQAERKTLSQSVVLGLAACQQHVECSGARHASRQVEHELPRRSATGRRGQGTMRSGSVTK